jgi:hypothetical protein
VTHNLQDLEPITGEISAPTVGGSVLGVHEDALIGDPPGEVPTGEEVLVTDEAATTYFNSVGDEEALNYIIFLHDANVISFDRLNQLKALLDETPSFLPEGF